MTTDSIIDDNPQLTVSPDNRFVLSWMKGSELSSVVDFDFLNREVIQADTAYSSNLADFKQASSTDGKVALIYAQPSPSNSSDLFGVFYDPVLKTWGKPRQLTSDPETEQRPSIAFQGQETVIATFNRKLMLASDNTVPTAPNVTGLYMLKYTLGVDLALDSDGLTTSPPNPSPGQTATLTVTAHNVGAKPANGVKVAFYNGNPGNGGSKIGETLLEGTLSAGNSIDASITWTIPATTEPLDIYAVIDPEATVDILNRSDNMANSTIVMPDLTIESVSWEKYTNQQIAVIARVANKGSLPSTPTTVTFRDSGASGEILATFELPTLGSGGATDYALNLDVSGLSKENYTIYIMVDEPNKVVEFDKNNNNRLITFQPGFDINGICGSSNGLSFATAPIGSLCTNGSTSGVVGSGPWDWTCNGSEGGNTDHCSATKSSYPPGNVTMSGEVCLADALKTLQAAKGVAALTIQEQGLADVAPLNSATMTPKGNGVVDLADAITILRRVVGAVNW
jgi:hypothetical protein